MIAILINEQGCEFDRDEFTNLKQAREWAKGRNGTYQLKIVDDNERYVLRRFRVKNNRFYEIHYYPSRVIE